MDSLHFESTFKAHFARLVNYADRILGDHQEALEVVQGVFMRYWEQRDERVISTSQESYLYKAVYHGCLNTVRHQKIVHRWEDAQMADLYFEQIIQQPGAEEFMRAEQIAEAVREAVATLPAQCRTIFELKQYAGLKNREVAEKLQLSLKTVENQHAIALKKLRKELDWLLIMLLLLHS